MMRLLLTAAVLFLLSLPMLAKVVGQEVTYSAGDVTMKGYLAYDDAVEGQRPGVLVVHEWWGHNPYARKRADMLAEMGYTALALDMYGDGKTADHPKDAMAFASAVGGNMAVARARFDAALKTLQEHPTVDPTQTAAIGYCFGGGIVLNMAREGADLDAVASFHGSLNPRPDSLVKPISARILVCNGADDPFVTQEQIDAFKEEMGKAGADMSIFNFPGAVHAFTNPDADESGKKFGLPLAYNQSADEKSWEMLTAFLKTTFAKPK
ncbi:MAG TPA: dienelactone hydrolase family protein [Calditrichia bacterium]|nr:dienelactone hydrolase family protein [Calditrichota bacterium]HQU71924.1 dienelactone hydrolase family protein [Calditrichia bacterium]HQV33057.1 dienelactone hydrolase family protein [Calditrichia bacterium]